jgi:hypothetical protein
MSWTGFNRTDQHPRFVADITGDGRADIVGLGRDGVWASLNSRGDRIMQVPRLVLRGFGANGAAAPMLAAATHAAIRTSTTRCRST